MKRTRRIGIVHASLALLALAVLVRTAHVQLIQGGAWSTLARRQHYTAQTVPAARGLILDAGGQTLATTRELVRLEVAPREVREPRRLRRALVAAGVDDALAARVFDQHRSWVTVPGRFVAEDVAPITAMRGVYTSPVSERTYSASPGIRAVIGRVDGEGRGLDGLELTLDSVLRGEAGVSRLLKGVRGRTFASPTAPGRAARQGHTVVLTINHELQEIAERTLADAVSRMEAEGGDIVILDPRGGEVLAMAGRRGPRTAASASATVVTEPFEPGSTLKPLIAAGLLARGRARTTDMVPTRGGSYKLHGRTVNDEPHDREGAGPLPTRLSLADVIRYSSNVGIVQFAERLTAREEFETLRDFGLGTPTGLPYSSEAAGTLRPPRTWSKQTHASLAMGYEVSLTPLQLALAYAAIANGGELLEPVLVKEIRTADGDVRYRQDRRVVRRVVPEHVAAAVRQLLSGVVERGTAVDADLATYQLGGKTGTPRRTVNGRYAPMQYNPNFVGLFPADDPQLVVVVKLSSPKGNFYGGRTAAPMTKTILEAALAARDAALDRSELKPRPRPTPMVAQSGSSRRTSPAVATARQIARAAESPVRVDSARPPTIVDLPVRGDSARAGPAPRRSVPNVTGMSLRDAVRSLHAAGFRVRLLRYASSTTPITEPAPGSVASAGSLVRLRFSR